MDMGCGRFAIQGGIQIGLIRKITGDLPPGPTSAPGMRVGSDLAGQLGFNLACGEIGRASCRERV
jgi:hypothetical protein